VNTSLNNFLLFYFQKFVLIATEYYKELFNAKNFQTCCVCPTNIKILKIVDEHLALNFQFVTPLIRWWIFFLLLEQKMLERKKNV